MFGVLYDQDGDKPVCFYSKHWSSLVGTTGVKTQESKQHDGSKASLRALVQILEILRTSQFSQSTISSVGFSWDLMKEDMEHKKHHLEYA